MRETQDELTNTSISSHTSISEVQLCARSHYFGFIYFTRYDAIFLIRANDVFYRGSS